MINKLIIVTFVLTGLALAQTANASVLNVYVGCTSQDTDLVGRRLCTHVKDLFARSPRFHLVDQQPINTVEVYLVSVDASVSNNGLSSAISVALVVSGGGKAPDAFIKTSPTSAAGIASLT